MLSALNVREEMAQAIELLHAATSFYTSEPIVERLLDLVEWPGPGSRLVDPSCGDGAFLSAALRRLLASAPDIEDKLILQVLQGWEIHYFAAAEARNALAQILVKNGRPAPHAQFLAQSIVVHGDFVIQGPQAPEFDLVCGNPPFLRYVNLPTILRTEYERTVPDYSQGDMLHTFIDRCTSVLRPGGEIALVTSDRWLFSQCAAKFRAAIGKRMGVHHLERLEAASAFYRPKNRRAGQPPRIHPVAVLLKESALCDVALTMDPLYPEADDGPYRDCVPLEEVANVRLCPWLGRHGLFVIDAATADTAGIPRDMLVPAIDTDNIKGGVLSPSTKFAIRTLRNVEPPEAVTRHLELNMHLLAKTKVRKTQRWLPPESFERMSLDQPSLLIPRIASGLKAVRIPPGILPLDHGISIVTAGSMSLEDLEAALSMPESEAWVRARAPRLENNYISLTTKLLRSLPIKL